jgi:hypothetical protein
MFVPRIQRPIHQLHHVATGVYLAIANALTSEQKSEKRKDLRQFFVQLAAFGVIGGGLLVLNVEWVLLQQKKEQHQLKRSDVERLMYLNLVLNGEYDEIDNYEKFLVAGDQ